MATLPTPQESATAIVEIFVNHFRLHAGQTLMRQNIDAVWPKQGHDYRDLPEGLQFALDQGWLEFNGRVFVLTESGFAAGGGVRHTDDDLARGLMSILVEGGHRAGEVVSPNRFIALWRKHRMYESDLSPAVQKSVELKWLLPVPRHGENWYEMTEAGFAAA